jgi:hypothetical protein
VGAPWHAGARDEVLVPLHLLVGICVYSMFHSSARDAAVMLATVGHKHVIGQATHRQGVQPSWSPRMTLVRVRMTGLSVEESLRRTRTLQYGSCLLLKISTSLRSHACTAVRTESFRYIG